MKLYIFRLVCHLAAIAVSLCHNTQMQKLEYAAHAIHQLQNCLLFEAPYSIAAC